METLVSGKGISLRKRTNVIQAILLVFIDQVAFFALVTETHLTIEEVVWKVEGLSQYTNDPERSHFSFHIVSSKNCDF